MARRTVFCHATEFRDWSVGSVPDYRVTGRGKKKSRPRNEPELLIKLPVRGGRNSAIRGEKKVKEKIKIITALRFTVLIQTIANDPLPGDLTTSKVLTNRSQVRLVIHDAESSRGYRIVTLITRGSRPARKVE